LRRQPSRVFDLSAVTAAGTIAMEARPTTRQTAALSDMHNYVLISTY